MTTTNQPPATPDPGQLAIDVESLPVSAYLCAETGDIVQASEHDSEHVGCLALADAPGAGAPMFTTVP